MIRWKEEARSKEKKNIILSETDTRYFHNLSCNIQGCNGMLCQMQSKQRRIHHTCVVHTFIYIILFKQTPFVHNFTLAFLPLSCSISIVRSVRSLAGSFHSPPVPGRRVAEKCMRTHHFGAAYISISVCYDIKFFVWHWHCITACARIYSIRDVRRKKKRLNECSCLASMGTQNRRRNTGDARHA